MLHDVGRCLKSHLLIQPTGCATAIDFRSQWLRSSPVTGPRCHDTTWRVRQEKNAELGPQGYDFFLAHPVPTGRTSMNSLCICVFKVAKCVKPVSVGRVSFVDLDPRRITIRF